ncbi:MAG TPA: FtsX-like permease family protein [Acidimicrobiia bacterium]|nr:FtsX-like permease family protein [Acidimicrobiia bacterium]
MRWLRLLTLSPWRRAPGRLLRAPSLFASIAVAALVLGIAAGSRPLFSSSAGTAALRSDVDQGCASDVGLRVQRQASTVSPAPATAGGALRPAVDVPVGTTTLDADVAKLPALSPVVITVFGGTMRLGPQGGASSASMQVLARTGFEHHVDVVHAVAAPGIWIPDTTARTLHLAAGDRVVLSDNFVATPLVVHAVFRDLAGGRRDRSWCSLQQALDGYGVAVPSPTGFLDRSTLLGVSSRAHMPAVEAWWEYAPDPAHWTVANATRTIPALEHIAAATSNFTLPEGRVFGLGTSSVDSESTLAHSDQASKTGSATVGPVALGGAGVALLVLLVAAHTWLDRRRKEVVVLALRGAGPAALAMKGVLELAPPMLLGGAIGVVAGDLLVRAVGPSSAIASHAVVSAAELVGAAVVVALAAIALVIWLGVRKIGLSPESVSARARLALWEPAVLAVAGAALYELSTRSGSPGSPSAGAHVDTLVLLFPVLLIAGCGGLLARAAVRSDLARLAGPRRATSLWLGLRRVAAARARAVPLIAGATVAVGIVVFSACLASSLRATIRAKSTLGPGSAQAFSLVSARPLPKSSPFGAYATEVTRTRENNNGGTDHARADVLGLDPATFARGAFWERPFSSRSLSSLVRALAEHDHSGVPALAIGDGLPDRFVLSLDAHHGTRSLSTTLAVDVVARPHAFPGLGFESDQPLVVIDRAALTKAGVTDTPEIWVNRTTPSIRSTLLAEGMPITSVVRASDFAPGDLAPQLWALRYLQIIGLVAGIVSLCGLGLYFASIADRRRLGIAVARHVGVSRRATIGATMTEVGTMIGAAVIFGSVLSVVAIGIVFSHIDPAPQIPPAPLFRIDLVAVAICLAGAVLATLLLATLVERTATRRSLAEMLRRAD